MKILSVLFSKKTIIQYFLHLCFFISYFLTPSDIIEPKKSRENGITLDYYENGALKSSRTFKDGLLNGESTFYNEDGTILKKEIYSKGMKK